MFLLISQVYSTIKHKTVSSGNSIEDTDDIHKQPSLTHQRKSPFASYTKMDYYKNTHENLNSASTNIYKMINRRNRVKNVMFTGKKLIPIIETAIEQGIDNIFDKQYTKTEPELCSSRLNVKTETKEKLVPETIMSKRCEDLFESIFDDNGTQEKLVLCDKVKKNRNIIDRKENPLQNNITNCKSIYKYGKVQKSNSKNKYASKSKLDFFEEAHQNLLANPEHNDLIVKAKLCTNVNNCKYKIMKRRKK